MHPGEVVEEKISLSERFGLWVSFYPFSQDEYLAITAQWLSSLRRAAAAIEAARPEALVWALERGSRSGRVAYQFARDYAGRHQRMSGACWLPTATGRAKAARTARKSRSPWAC